MLHYITHESKRLKTFVANRVAEIVDNSKIEEWRHVDGTVNPADCATRGMKLEDLTEDCLWFRGPDFLYRNESEWPKFRPVDIPEENLELKNELKVHLQIEKKENDGFPFQRFSNWFRMVSVVAWMLRLKTFGGQHKGTPISLRERRVSENCLFKMIQQEAFQEDIRRLKAGLSLLKSSKIRRLDPFFDNDGILRVGGRIKYSLIPFAAKHQIILPKNYHSVYLLIEFEHKMMLHGPKEQLMAQLRRRYWIIGCRRMIARIIRSCRRCIERSSKPSQQFMADLPESRLAICSPPFFHTGVDYFGPLEVKYLWKHLKRWGCIFTCMTTRAVHLEISPSLEADEFINTLQRFINRRGCPGNMYSDNGSNFRGAESELKEAVKQMDQEKVTQFAVTTGLEWHFNPPEAPHMGGSWERLIQGIKRSLVIVLKDTVLDDYSLSTVFTEVENMANNRPLTTISDDVDDFEALTPNHFLIGRANPHFPLDVKEMDIKPCFRKRWKQILAVSTHYWRRWRADYLPKLTERCKWQKRHANFRIGDLVFLHDRDVPKGVWPLGRIIDIHPGKDGKVRVVEVKTAKGTYTRPITKLFKFQSIDENP